jgi:hypothetical protein
MTPMFHCDYRAKPPTLGKFSGLPHGRLTLGPRSVGWRYTVELMQRAGIEGPMACCNGMRHTFGMFALAHGVPQNLVQRWLEPPPPSTSMP